MNINIREHEHAHGVDTLLFRFILTKNRVVDNSLSLFDSQSLRSHWEMGRSSCLG